MRNKDDDRLRLRLENKLSNQGLRAPCRLSVDVYHKTVTLNGIVQYDYQKRAEIQAARSMDGVAGVIDRVKVQAPVRTWEEEPHVPRSAVEEPVDQMPGPVASPDEPL